MKETRKAVANRKMCIGCRLCTPNEAPCPENAISFDELGKVVINEKSCTGCGLCRKRCPKGIISIQVIQTQN